MVDDLDAQAVDVHGTARAPVDQALGCLRGAVDRDAAIGNLALLTHHARAARGAGLGHLELNGIGGAQLKDGPHDLGNHVARLVHHDGIAHAHVLAADLVDVVQGRARDGRAGHQHGVELGHRGKHAGAAHLHTNLAQHGALLLGRELEGDRPAGRTGGKSQGGLVGKRVDLDHHAIDVVVQLFAPGQGIGAKLMDLGRARAAGGVGIHAKAAVAQPPQELPLRRDGQRRLVCHGIDEGLQVAVGGHARVLLAKAAGGGVSRVGKGLAAGGVGVLVQAHKAVLGHVDLATDLDVLAETCPLDLLTAGGRELVRHVCDGQDIGRDVFAGGAVAAGGRAHKLGVAVGQGHAQAVDLKLTGVGHTVVGAGAQGLVGAAQPLVQLGQVHGVVHRVHARGVRHRLKLLAHVAAHTLGIRVGGDQLRVVALKPLELNQQTVELGVGHLRLVQGVVAVGVGVEKTVELGGAGANGVGERGRTGRFYGRRRRRRLIEAVKQRPLQSVRALLASHASPIK